MAGFVDATNAAVPPVEASPTEWEEAAPPRTTARRIWDFLSGPYPTLVSRLVLAGMFLVAGLTKLGVPASFTASINSYEMPLPSWLVQIMANGLPPLELVIGLFLLVGLFTRLTGVVTGGLMLIFLIALIQAWVRGLDVDCGCFSGVQVNPLGADVVRALGPIGTFLSNEKVGLDSVVRDTVLLLMSIHLIAVPTALSLDSLRSRFGGSAETAPDETAPDVPAEEDAGA